jgi:uncharacterized protein YciI
MLFIVTLANVRPIEEVDKQLDAHRAWLAANTRDGRIAVAGPLESRTGGLIVASCADRAELDEMMARDPFVVERLVTVNVAGVVPAIRHADFPARWATDAKTVSAR